MRPYFLFLIPLFLFGETADLRNPTYKNGILYTNEGGVIRGEELRIQAQNIQYIHRKSLEAEGDLMFQYKDHLLVGSCLEYDFVTRCGRLYDGKVFFSPWYIGGDEILIEPDGSYQITDAFFTTCENRESSWDLHAGKVSIKDRILSADKLRIRLFKVPIFALPSFKVTMKKFKEPIFRYSINWDKSQGPRISVRYQFYSWETAALYGRLEYRWGTGFGGAFESEYCSLDKSTTCVTRSYLGSDRLENAPDKQRRYRLQGALLSTSSDQKTGTILTWDKYSDVRMPNDFKSDDFEVNTAQRTLFSVSHQEKSSLFSLKVRPRINPFESIKQDLPTLFFSLRTIPIKTTGVLFDLYSRASYLDFAYSDRLTHSIMGLHSFRAEIRPLFYRPLHLGPLILTPNVGGLAIFYNTSQSHSHKTLAAISYGGSAITSAVRTYEEYRHTIQPYFNYYGLTRPTVSPDRHFIFSLQDGYNHLNQLQVGLRNTLSNKLIFVADLYANILLGPHHFAKIYLSLDWQFSSLELLLFNCWNMRHHTIDFSQSLLRWTVNEDIAFSLEARYRSQYDWRKSDRESFIIDVSRSESELLLSPLSNQQSSLLFHAFFRLTPFWECHMQSHHGYINRTPQNPYSKQPYNEFKIDLYTWISSSWKLRLSYTHTLYDDRVTAGLSLIKK